MHVYYDCLFQQDLLLKDLPDPSKKRRYSRRPTITSLRGDDLTGNGHIGDFIHKVEHVPEGETPSIRVENLTANWGSVEVLLCRMLHTHVVPSRP